MEDFKIAVMFLFGCVAMTTSQHCIKQYVGGEWITHGDCGNLPTISSVLRDLEERAKAEEAKEALPSLRCGDEPWEPAKSRNETGGVVDIDIPGLGMKEVYCDMRTDGGGWIVFQRRMDGSEDFVRNWTDYDSGFGARNKEFWLGLEAIHQLTKDGNHELRIDMIERSGTHYYAKYSNFEIGPSSDNFRLRVSGYSGNSSDSFEQPTVSIRVHQFSTVDKDNDASPSQNCADLYQGGWWFHNCHHSNLNGPFDDVSTHGGIVWYDQTKRIWMHMRRVEMKIKRKNV